MRSSCGTNSSDASSYPAPTERRTIWSWTCLSLGVPHLIRHKENSIWGTPLAIDLTAGHRFKWVPLADAKIWSALTDLFIITIERINTWPAPSLFRVRIEWNMNDRRTTPLIQELRMRQFKLEFLRTYTDYHWSSRTYRYRKGRILLPALNQSLIYRKVDRLMNYKENPSRLS